METRTVSIGEASSILRISTEAIRKRIKRGSLKAHKDDDGQWLVDLDEKTMAEIAHERAAGAFYPGGNGPDVTLDTLRSSSRLEETLEDEVAFLREEITFLRQEMARLDNIIMSLTQNMKMLEGPRTAAERPQMSWWHRLKSIFMKR